MSLQTVENILQENATRLLDAGKVMVLELLEPVWKEFPQIRGMRWEFDYEYNQSTHGHGEVLVSRFSGEVNVAGPKEPVPRILGTGWQASYSVIALSDGKYQEMIKPFREIPSDIMAMIFCGSASVEVYPDGRFEIEY